MLNYQYLYRPAVQIRNARMPKKMNDENREDDNKINTKESNYLFIATSQLPNSGNGLFSSINIHKDEIIAEYKGEILSNERALKRAKLGHDAYFVSMPNGDVMDSRKTKCFAKYANDVCGSVDSIFKNNAKIAFDDNDKICLIALKKIKEGDEIFCAYGFRYWKNQRRLISKK